MAIDLFRFYEKVLVPLTPNPAVTRLLQLIVGGGETNEDFAQIISKDHELQLWVRTTCQRLGLLKRELKIDQMIGLLGQDRIRNFVIGRTIERAYVLEDQTLLAQIRKDDQANKSKAPAKETKTPSKGSAPSGPTAELEAEIIVPNLNDFERYLEFGIQAEDIAIEIRNSYPGQAFAAGVIFDHIRSFIKTKDFSGLKDPRLQNSEEFVKDLFRDSVRNGIAAHEIMQKISISHQRVVFATAMLQNIGKLLLYAFDPVGFEHVYLASTGAKDVSKKIDSSEAEMLEFGMDHAQIGSLYIGRISFLAETERSIDFHNSPHLLKFSNPPLYALASILRTSSALNGLFQKHRQKNPNTNALPDSTLTSSTDFKFLKLTTEEWAEVKTNYALQLLKLKL